MCALSLEMDRWQRKTRTNPKKIVKAKGLCVVVMCCAAGNFFLNRVSTTEFKNNMYTKHNLNTK